MASKFPYKHRIVWSIFLPVVAVGIVFAVLSTFYLSTFLTSLLKEHIESDLRLSAEMAISICEYKFNDLLELRLENDQEMINTVRKETVDQIKMISKKFPLLNMLIIEDNRLIESSFSLPSEELHLPPLRRSPGNLSLPDFGGKPAIIYYQYFPFWKWHVASLIYEKDYLAPILSAQRIVYLGTSSILAVLFLTVYLVFDWRVKKPLKKIMAATEIIARGDFKKLAINRRDEIGRVGLAFNSMVDSLQENREKIRSIMAELQESEERYRLLTEYSLAIIIMIEEGRIIYANKMGADNYDYPLEELLGIDILEIIHPDDRDFFKKRLTSLQEKEIPAVHEEFKCRTRSGEDRWLELLAILINYQGRMVILGHGIDISDKKVAALEKTRLEAQLYQAQKLEAIGILAGGIAHDFNNSLTAILGNINLATTDPQLTADTRERLLQAEKACLLARSLSKRLLTFAKGGEPIKKAISLREVLTESVNLTLAGSKCIWELSLPDDFWLVEADEGQINQVISNLLVNADQAMPAGGVIKVQGENVTVGERRESSPPPGEKVTLAPGKYVKIAVIDQGGGIPPEHLEKVFEPFFSTKPKCSGLGLTTAYSIIKSHKGYLNIVSEVGVGTSCSIYLPAIGAPARPAGKMTATPLQGHGKILIMDDDEKVRSVLDRMLKAIGYDVVSSDNGANAIELYKEALNSDRPFAAVIFDLTVPGGMGGMEALEQLLKIDRHIKAIVSSGYSDDPIMAEFTKYGFSNVILKPYRISELSKVLLEVVNGRADPGN